MNPWQSPTIDELDGVAVVHVQGSIDARTAPELEHVLDDLRKRGHLQVVLDLAEVGVVSSAGLGVLLGALGAFHESSGGLGLAAMPRPVARVLDLLGFTPLFPVGVGVAETCARLREALS